MWGNIPGKERVWEEGTCEMRECVGIEVCRRKCVNCVDCEFNM